MYTLIYFILFILILVFVGAFFGAPWVPTRRKDFDRIAELVELHPGTLFYDLGSGNGEMLFYLSEKYNVNCVGIEISPILYLYSKIKSFFYKKVKIQYGNFFKYDLSKADVIYFFLLPKVFKKLKQKIEKEAKNGARIIVSCWLLKEDSLIRISKKEGELTYYLYVVQKEESCL